MNDKLNVIIIFAHPDEGEIYAGGTAALFAQAGHRVKFLSLTNGDAGHWDMAPEDLARRRFQEALESQRILGLADYEVFSYHDGVLENTAEIRRRVAACIRDWQADLAFLFYPLVAVPGGHNDNMQAGLIVREAAAELEMDNPPAFLYMRDYFTTDFLHIPDIALDIGAVWEVKLEALAAHVSQVVEANPHADGILAEVLGSAEKRREYLFYNTYPFSRVTPDIRLALEKWYGREAAQQIHWAEAFEIAEFGRPLDDQALAALFPMLGHAFTLPGACDWLDTGLDVCAGQMVELRAAGEVVWEKTDFCACGPTGAALDARQGRRPVLNTGTGALLGRIGAAPAFQIGDSLRLEAGVTGRLYLGINDDDVGDNAGFFTVWIRL